MRGIINRERMSLVQNMQQTKMLFLFIFWLFIFSFCSKDKDEVKDTTELKPKITLLIPNSAYNNDTIKIVGENFGSRETDVSLTFGGNSAEIVSVSDKLITTIVPYGIGVVKISVKVKGNISNSISFTYRKIIADTTAVADKKRIKALLESSDPINWVFTGNSITQGAKHTHGMKPYSEIFAERIRWEMQRPYDIIINTAISGHTTQNIINDFDKRLSRFNPRVVVLMIGTNDAAENRNISTESFGNNLIILIDRIREIGAIPIVMSPNIIITEKSPERRRLPIYVEKMKQITRTKNVTYVDNWSIWSTELQQKYHGEVFKKLMNDPLHPNGYGHKEIAEALFRELSIFDPEAPTCGGTYYEER